MSAPGVDAENQGGDDDGATRPTIRPSTDEAGADADADEFRPEEEEEGVGGGGNGAAVACGSTPPQGGGADAYYDPDREPVAVRFDDHFSLTFPPSSVRFRGSNVRVYDQWSSQLLLESHPSPSSAAELGSGAAAAATTAPASITVKRAPSSSFRLRALRAVYTLVCLFFAGFLFVFCFQILLFLFLGFLDEAGLTSHDPVVPAAFVGTVLSVPIFLYGLSACMVLAASFVSHTWDGYTFLRTVTNADVVAVEWATFVVLLGIPLATMAVTLFAKTEDWWVITSLTWICCVLGLFLVYGGAVIYYECSSALNLVHMLDPSYGRITSRWSLLRRAVLLGQVHRLAGVKKSFFVVSGDLQPPEGGSYALSGHHVPTEERMMPYSRMTTLACCLAGGRLFTRLDPPRRIYTVDEARGVVPFLTRHTWSLDKMFCAYGQRKVIAVVQGPSALRPDQMRSSLACVVVGSFLGVLLFAGFLVWFGVSGAAVATFTVLVALCCCAPNAMVAARMFRLYRGMTDLDPIVDLEPIEPITKPIADMGKKLKPVEEKLSPIGRQVAKLDPIHLHGQGGGVSGARRDQSERYTGGNGDQSQDDIEMSLGERAGAKATDQSRGIYRTFEKLRVTRPSNGLCWALVAIDFIFLFLWPLVTTFYFGNYAVAALFLVVALFTITRHYLNAAVVLEELGSFDVIGDTRSVGRKESDANEPHSDERWKARARLNDIVSNVSRGRSRNTWFAVFVFVVAILLFLSITAIATRDDDASTEFDPSDALHDFHYEPTDGMRYPSCEMKKGLGLTGGETTALADYAFVSKLAYASVASTQPSLDAWFGEGMAKDGQDTVDTFRTAYEGRYSGVSYKLITFPDHENFAVVTVRGSSTAYDWLTNMRLWSLAALAQGLRFLLPGGEIWTPILSQLVKVASLVEGKQLLQVSYYKETAAFVRELKQKYNYTDVHVTGHSLGGGIALITGAQTGEPAIGLSAPNSMISRLTYDPPVTKEQLNTHVFNIVPNHDLVPMIDDLANLYQRIECRAPKNEPFACHSSLRALCEIMYNCGSGPRPLHCDCVTKFGYEPPLPSGNRTFEEACKQD